MLLSFRFANHRSFRDEQQLNLLLVYDADSEAPLDAVKVVGVFSANASGKSNVISAISYLSEMVGTSDRKSEPDVGPTRRPFHLDPVIAAQPSNYAVDLTIDGVRHTYGFTVDDDQIIEECLYAYPLHKKRVVFERTRQDFPLSEFKPRRQGENRPKRYLNGSYGAIPEISMRVFEQAVSSRTDTDAELGRAEI